MFFYSILPPGTELLPFCTFFLLLLIFTVLVQILTPATDFYPSLLQHWRITKNSKIQGSQNLALSCTCRMPQKKSQARIYFCNLSPGSISWSREFLYISHSVSLLEPDHIHGHFSCMNQYKGITNFSLIHSEVSMGWYVLQLCRYLTCWTELSSPWAAVFSLSFTHSSMHLREIELQLEFLVQLINKLVCLFVFFRSSSHSKRHWIESMEKHTG